MPDRPAGTPGRQSTQRPPALILAFDFGLRRIGIASGNLLTRTASPLTTLECRGELPWGEIDKLLAEWRPDRVVVGQPGASANPDLQAALEEFCAALVERSGIRLERTDESHTSTAAEESLRAGRAKGIYNRRLNKKQIDAAAACLIAEQWMNDA